MNQRTHVAMYFESFCQTLDVEGDDVSFVDTLNQQNMKQVTMRNLDSGQISTMDHPVWDMDANQWLDELMADLREPPPPETADSCWVDKDDVFAWLDDSMGTWRTLPPWKTRSM